MLSLCQWQVQSNKGSVLQNNEDNDMKARVKATGEIVEVTRIMEKYIDTYHPQSILFDRDELDFFEDTPDYWEKLKHQYAGMAMQAILSSNVMMEILSRRDNGTMEDEVAMEANDYATALVEKLKEEK